MKTTIYEVTVGSHQYGIKQLKPSDMIKVFKAAGSGADALTTTNEALRMSIVEIDGKPYGYQDLFDLSRVIKRARDRRALGRAWSEVHDGTPESLEAAQEGTEVTDVDDVEYWTFPLGDRKVTLRECSDIVVSKALRASAKKSKNQSAQGFIAILENLQEAICRIDGKDVSLGRRDMDKLFTVPEIHTLSAIWYDLHMGGEEDFSLGETHAVSGHR